MDWNIYYSNVRTKVINLLKQGELKEGSLNINYIMSEVMKESIMADLGLKRKVIKSPTKDYVDMNVLYRDDSSNLIKIKGKTQPTQIKQ